MSTRSERVAEVERQNELLLTTLEAAARAVVRWEAAVMNIEPFLRDEPIVSVAADGGGGGMT